MFSKLSRALKLSVCSMLFLALTSSAFASQVTLGWDAVSAPDVAGYMLYYGYVSGSYSMSVDVGNNTMASLSGLDEGKSYYFVATVYDVYGQESPSSNEVRYDVPVGDTISPTVAITSPSDGASVSRRSTVTIGATASDDVGVTVVEFYVNGQLTCSTVTSPYTCAWQVPAANGRTYQLQASAYDAHGNVGESSIVTVKAQ